MATQPLENTIPCCLVVDTSALLTDTMDMIDLLTRLLPKTPHVLVVPQDVLAELHGLTKSIASAKAAQAESLLRALQRFPDFKSKTLSSSSSSSPSPPSTTAEAASLSTNRPRGVAVLQRHKDTYYPLVKFARNRDTKIVACAYHFTMNEEGGGFGHTSSNSSGRGATLQAVANARRFGCRRAFFVTNDVVQQIKASPYKIPTIDSAALKLHWGHLGHWNC